MYIKCTILLYVSTEVMNDILTSEVSRLHINYAIFTRKYIILYFIVNKKINKYNFTKKIQILFSFLLYIYTYIQINIVPL